MRFHNRPDEEYDAGHGDEVCFHREKMADLVHWEPDGWEGAGPEEKEGQKVAGICARRCWYGAGKVVVGCPDRADHEGNALPLETKSGGFSIRIKRNEFTSDPRLHTVPDTSHSSSIENRP